MPAGRWGPDQWQEATLQLQARARGRCECCGSRLPPGIGVRHHRQLRSQGGVDSLENLLLLLPEHHADRVHAHPAWAREHGFIVGMSMDPATTPIVTCQGGPRGCRHHS